MTITRMQPATGNHLAGTAMDAYTGKYLDRRLLSNRSEWSVAVGVLIAVVVIVALLALLGFGLSVRIVKQYEQGVLFRLGRLRGSRAPGFQLIIPVVDVLHRVSLRVVTMPIQSQGIITRDNVSVDVSAVAYYKVADAVKSVVAIENVQDAIGRSPRPRCGRSSASTPSTRRCPKPTRSTWTSARSSTPPRPSGAWR
jgi:hypothetical protein